MAKLPQIDYNTSTQKLAKPDTEAPARIAGQKFQLISQVGNLANQIAHGAAKHQANQARSNATQRIADWEKEHDGRSFYSADELREQGVKEEVILGRDEIPAHEVSAGLYRENYEKVIEEESKKIWFAPYKKRFELAAENDLATTHAARVVKASQQQEQEQNAQILTDIDQLVLDRRYDFAIERTKELAIPRSKRQDLRKKIKEDKEFSGYVDLVNFRDVEGAKEALKTLTKEDSKNLTEQKQFQAIRMLETFISGESKVDQLRKSESAFKLQRIEKAAIAGKFIDLDYVNQTVKEAQDAGVEPRHFVKMQTALKANKFANGIANLPANEQMAAMQARTLSKKTVEGGIEANYMESIVKGNIAYMNKDMLGYSHSVNGNVPTIDFIGLTEKPGQTAAALVDRMRRHNIAKETLGVSQGYLKDEEVDVLADILLNSSIDEITAFTREVNQAMGRDGAILFDQIRVKRKEIGSLAVAGQLALIGAPAAGSQVLRGHEYRKNNPEVIQSLETEFLPEIHQQLKGVYSNSPRYLNSIKNAILDVYATKAVAEGLSMETLDSSLLEDSVRTVTGGVIEHGDNAIEPPYYGATQAIMDTWVENLHPDYIEDMGGAWHYSNKEITKKLKDEDFQLESIGFGRYVIQTGKGGYLANKQGTAKFVLEFDMNAPIVNQSNDGIPIEKNYGDFSGPGRTLVDEGIWLVDPMEWGNNNADPY